jgi:hypothetical protein
MRVDNCVYTLNDAEYWQCTISKWVHRKKTTKPPRGICPICSEKKLTPEQLAQREAARAEQEEQARREAEALRPEGERLGWDFGMVVRYAAALKKWVAAGRPTRTDEEIEAIEAICKQCEKYEPIEGRCSVCGCKILTPGITIMSKAKLATEKCPKGKW